MLGLKLLLFGAFLLVIALISLPQLRWNESGDPHRRGWARGAQIYLAVGVPLGVILVIVGIVALVL
jgi:uncharacterized membrane protein YidH (DUF202 family)